MSLHSHEAEQSVIGACLLDNKLIDRASDVLTHADFAALEHAVDSDDPKTAVAALILSQLSVQPQIDAQAQTERQPNPSETSQTSDACTDVSAHHAKRTADMHVANRCRLADDGEGIIAAL